MSCGSDTQYLVQHGVPRIVDHMLRQMLQEKPDDPLKFMKEYTEKQLRASENGGSVGANQAGGGLQRTLSFSRPSHFRPALVHIMTDPQFNKGTAFSEKERDQLGLQGLLPYQVEDLPRQVERCEQQLRSFGKPLEKFTYLTTLKETNQTLFYSLLLKNLEECLPLIYTPTVGEACLKFDGIYSHPQGMYINSKHRGRIADILDNWVSEVDIIVVTDGSRILGLGDLGANGMGIPVGKLALYVVAAGFHPARTLPVHIDTGTGNKRYLEEDPLYLGERRPRMPDEEYDSLLDEFLVAVKAKWPECLLQFEDFSQPHCFTLLERYRKKMRCFNDDIQGTGAVVAAGFLNAVRLSGIPLNEQVIVFYGAGSAGVGVAEQIMGIMAARGMDRETARRAFYLVDTKGLVTTNRGDKLQEHKVPWARTDQAVQLKDLVEIIRALRPTALIGLSGTPGVFTEEAIREMAKHRERPIIFPLSNPTSKAECSAEQAYTWTDGRAIFAAGSPFAPVTLNGVVHTPGQGNNMYIFPGLGMGSFLSRASEVSDEMILAASEALVECVSEEMLSRGTIYPPLSSIREISVKIAVRVMEKAREQGLNGVSYPSTDLPQFVEQNMWTPAYFHSQ